ncbi:MAG: tetraacyldisaccharide 4'-kinase [Phycisphaerae bacterium]|nr:tetraacyldisaccharide 4'-kinase [Phycisphaerae bacterium]
MKTPLPSWLDFFALPASLLYGLIVNIRNRHYDTNASIQKVDKPVIAVGNITVGGTGKTPLVTWIVKRLRAHGHNPAVVMRGYAAVDPAKADEALEYHERLHDIDVIVGADRAAMIRSYIENGGTADCFVMDDGFQHRRLHRDLDIVVMDFLRNAFLQRMLPAGWLREPVSGLKRADAVVVSHAGKADPSFAKSVEAEHGKKPIAWASHQWTGLQLFNRNGCEGVGLDWLTGKSIAVRLGIGHPRPVIEALVRLGAKIAMQLEVGDHQPFTKEELDSLATASNNVDGIVMTLKDWVKARELVDFSDMQCPIVVPDLALDIIEGDNELETLLLSVFQDTMNT